MLAIHDDPGVRDLGLVGGCALFPIHALKSAKSAPFTLTPVPPKSGFALWTVTFPFLFLLTITYLLLPLARPFPTASRDSLGSEPFQYEFAAGPAALDQRMGLFKIGGIDCSKRLRSRGADHTAVDKIRNFLQ